MAEANIIISSEHDNVRHSQYESINDIIVTDATSIEEFDRDKAKKKTMLAHMLKNQLESYYRNNDPEKDEEYKSIINGLMNEYDTTDSLVFVEKEEKKR